MRERQSESRSDVAALLQHMDEQYQADWDGQAIRAELLRLHALNSDLLEALKYWAVRDPYNQQTRAAIAKAEGMNKAEGK